MIERPRGHAVSEPKPGHKRVPVRFHVDLDVDVPEEWTDAGVEFWLNESSWCAGNLVDLLTAAADAEGGCLCSRVDAEVAQDSATRQPGRRRGALINATDVIRRAKGEP